MTHATKEELDRKSVVELREMLRVAGVGGVLRSLADRALATSILTGETKASDWLMTTRDDGTMEWLRRESAAPAPVPAPAPAPAPETPADMLTRALGAMLGADLETRLAAMEKRIAEHGAHRTLRIERWDGTETKIDGPSHAMLAEAVARVTRRGVRNLLLYGPAGSGKSTLAEQLAKALGVPYYFLSLSGDVTASHLIGLCPVRITDGTVHHVPSPLTAAWEAPGVVCLDELDRADPSTACALNAALAQGRISIPQVAKVLARHPQLVVVGTANTALQGSDGRYTAAQAQDAALADRLVAPIRVDYDVDLERAIARGLANGKAEIADAVCAAVWGWRRKAAEVRFTTPITTRWIQALVPAAVDGVPSAAWLRYCAPWIQDVDAKRLEPVPA